MAILQATGTTLSAAIPATETIGSAMGDSLSAIVMDDNEVMTAKGVRWAVATYVAVTALATSMFTRKRVAEGLEPIAGALF